MDDGKIAGVGTSEELLKTNDISEKYMNHRSKEAETMNKKKKLDQNTIQTAKRLLKYMTEPIRYSLSSYLSASLSVPQQVLQYPCP